MDVTRSSAAILLDAFPNSPIVLDVLIVNQPKPFHVLERRLFDLRHRTNYHEPPDFDRYKHLGALLLYFERLSP